MKLIVLCPQSKITELQGSLTAAETAHRTVQESLLTVTSERDDLKEAVSTLRKRIRDLEALQARTQAEVAC